MKTEDKVRRWLYLLNFIVVLGGQLWILDGQDWNIWVVYTTYMFPWYIVIWMWLHLWWGLHNLLKFINNHVDIDEIDDIGKKEE